MYINTVSIHTAEEIKKALGDGVSIEKISTVMPFYANQYADVYVNDGYSVEKKDGFFKIRKNENVCVLQSSDFVEISIY